MQAHETTVNSCLGPPVYFCSHWISSLCIRNVPFYTGATQNRSCGFTRLRQMSAYTRVHFKSRLYRVSTTRCKCCAEHICIILALGPPPLASSRYLYGRIVSCRIFATRRETLDIKITHHDIGKRWDRTVNIHVTGLPMYPLSRCLHRFHSSDCPGASLF